MWLRQSPKVVLLMLIYEVAIEVTEMYRMSKNSKVWSTYWTDYKNILDILKFLVGVSYLLFSWFIPDQIF